MAKARAPDPRSRPPWDGPAAHTLLDGHAPGTLPADRQAVWLELLRATLVKVGNVVAAADALGVPRRTFHHWLAALSADFPALERQLPPRAQGRPKKAPQRSA